MSQVFYRKWRPQTLADVAGQEIVSRTLRNALNAGRISHAYLFAGPRGTGKTSTARILAKAVNCLANGKGEPCNTCAMCQAITDGRALDVIEIDAASNTGVDDIRELRERVNYAPNQARFKVYIIDEVHMLSTSAANALLKTLEEPPPHVIFILATTEVHKILPTIMSRCQRFDFHRVSLSDTVGRLEHICRAEGIKIEPEAIRLVARSATGSLRDAETLLEQIATYYGTEITLAQVQATLGVTGDRRVRELAGHIVAKDISAGLTAINGVNSDGLDLRQFHRELVEYLRALLLVKTSASDALDYTAEDIADLKALAAKATLEQVVQAVRLFGQLNLRLDSYSTLPLELALIDSITADPTAAPSPAAAAAAATTAPSTPASPANPSPAKPASRPAAPPSSNGSRTAPRTANRPAGASPSPVRPTSPRPAAAGTPVNSGIKPASAPPKPAANPEPVRAAPVAPLEASTEIDRLKLNWKLIVEQAPADVRRNRGLSVWRSGQVKPQSIQDDLVCLACSSQFFKETIEIVENQRVVQKLISNFLGRTCRIQCVLEEKDNHLVEEALKIPGAQFISVEEK